MLSRVPCIGFAAFLAVTVAAAAADVQQNVVNQAPVVNNGTIVSGVVAGVSNSSTVSATGALAQVSALNAFANVNLISGSQSATNAGAVINSGSAVFTGPIAGGANSVSISATGAVASMSASGIRDVAANIQIGDIKGLNNQTAVNSGAVLNRGAVAVFGGFGGYANSLSVSATGALAQTSVSAVAGNVQFANIFGGQQTVGNTASVTNFGAVIVAGSLSGLGNSVSVTATGAAAAVSVSTTSGNILGAAVNANQTVINSGAVTNLGSIQLGSINGLSNTVTISATGALAQVNLSSLGGVLTAGTPITASQSAVNTGNVTNVGNVTNAGGVVGTGNSISISTVGAAAVTSYSTSR